MNTKALMAISGISLLLATASTYAHHSFAAEYDINKPITIKGTIARFDLVNPHSWLYVDVKDTNGKTTKWNIEWGSANTLIRRGVNKNNIPIGQEVTVVGYAARDSSTTMNGTSVRMAYGRTLFYWFRRCRRTHNPLKPHSHSQPTTPISPDYS